LEPSLLAAVPASGRHWVLTPHEGEFARLTNGAQLTNRIENVRDFASASGCVVLLKGPTTIIASPTGRLRIVRSGTTALATAGSGDVLAGLIGATIARGHDEFEASALAAHLHGRAGARLATYAPASALPAAITEILDELTNRAEYVGDGGDHAGRATRTLRPRRARTRTTRPDDDEQPGR